MLQPKKVKFRKQQRGRMRGKAPGGFTVSFGEFGLKALQPCWMTNRQIEAARIAMTRHIKRGGKVWIRVFPDKPVTKKPAETRMGKGKGGVDKWVAVVKRERIICEISGVAFFCRHSDDLSSSLKSDPLCIGRQGGRGEVAADIDELLPTLEHISGNGDRNALGFACGRIEKMKGAELFVDDGIRPRPG